MASPRLRLLRNFPLVARRSAASRSLAFFSSCRAIESRSASSRRMFFGRNRAVAGAEAPRPPRVVLGVRPGVGVALGLVVPELPAAAPARPRPVPLPPRFMMDGSEGAITLKFRLCRTMKCAEWLIEGGDVKFKKFRRQKVGSNSWWGPRMCHRPAISTT